MAKKKKKTKKKSKSKAKKSARRSAAKPKPPERITSQRKLAIAYTKKFSKVSNTTVSKWVKDPRWGFGTGPWEAIELDLMREWRLATLEAPNESGQTNLRTIEDMSDLEKAKLAMILERVQFSRLRREILQGKHLPKDEVFQRETKFALWYKSVLLRMPRDIRSKLGPKYNSQQAEFIERRIETYIRSILLKMAGHE